MVVHAPSNEILYLGKHEEHIASVCVFFVNSSKERDESKAMSKSFLMIFLNDTL